MPPARPRLSDKPLPARPFATAEEAWFWAAAALRARREGARSGGGALPRPCTPDDVLLCLDRLYRTRRIDLIHARVLQRWGDAGLPPDPRRSGDHGDFRLWREALSHLEPALMQRGIVHGRAGAEKARTSAPAVNEN